MLVRGSELWWRRVPSTQPCGLGWTGSSSSLLCNSLFICNMGMRISTLPESFWEWSEVSNERRILAQSWGCGPGSINGGCFCHLERILTGWTWCNCSSPRGISFEKAFFRGLQNSQDSKMPLYLRNFRHPDRLVGRLISVREPALRPSDTCSGSCEQWTWIRTIRFRWQFRHLPVVWPWALHDLILYDRGLLFSKVGIMIYHRVY